MLTSKLNKIIMKHIIENEGDFKRDDVCIDMKKIEELSYEDKQKIFHANEIKIANEIYECIKNINGKPINKNINIHILSLSEQYVKNLDKGIKMGKWGFTFGRPGKLNEYKEEDLKRMKVNDILLFVVGWTSSKDNRKHGRPSYEEYDGIYPRITAVVITDEVKFMENNYWGDGKSYPYVIGISQSIFEIKDVPCSSSSLGPYLFDTIRNFNSFDTIRQIDLSSMIKFLN